jgi:hypothetical protein
MEVLKFREELKIGFKTCSKVMKKNRLKFIIKFYLFSLMNIISSLFSFVYPLVSIAFYHNILNSNKNYKYTVLESFHTLDSEKKVKKAIITCFLAKVVLISILVLIALITLGLFGISAYLFKLTNSNLVNLIWIIPLVIMALVYLLYVINYLIPVGLIFEYDSSISINRALRLTFSAFNLKYKSLILNILFELFIHLIFIGFVCLTFINKYTIFIGILLIIIYILCIPRIRFSCQIARTNIRLKIISIFETNLNELHNEEINSFMNKDDLFNDDFFDETLGKEETDKGINDNNMVEKSIDGKIDDLEEASIDEKTYDNLSLEEADEETKEPNEEIDLNTDLNKNDEALEENIDTKLNNQEVLDDKSEAFDQTLDLTTFGKNENVNEVVDEIKEIDDKDINVEKTSNVIKKAPKKAKKVEESTKSVEKVESSTKKTKKSTSKKTKDIKLSTNPVDKKE